MSEIVRIQLHLKHTATTVWKALTDSTALTQWLSEHAEIDLPNKHYDFWGRYTPENPDRAAGAHPLLAQEDARHLKFEWTFRLNELTTVEIYLKADADSTILTLRHDVTSIESYLGRNYNLQDFWFVALENLRRYLDSRPSEARANYAQSETTPPIIRYELDVDASSEQVFAVLTDSAQVDRWIATDAAINLEDKQYDLGWEGIPPAKILDLVENAKLSHEWSNATVVTWTLAESNGKTRLTFVHSGFADDHDVGDIKTGWLNFVNWVRSVAEYGDTWQPPILEVPEEQRGYYPKSIIQLQVSLLSADQI